MTDPVVKIGIIGGSGLDDPQILKDANEVDCDTPYGEPSSSLTVVTFLSFVLSCFVLSLVLLLSLDAAFSSRAIWSSVKPCFRSDSLYSSENSALFSSFSSTVGSVISMTTSSRKLRSSSMESSGNSAGFLSSAS